MFTSLTCQFFHTWKVITPANIFNNDQHIYRCSQKSQSYPNKLISCTFWNYRLIFCVVAEGKWATVSQCGGVAQFPEWICRLAAHGTLLKAACGAQVLPIQAVCLQVLVVGLIIDGKKPSYTGEWIFKTFCCKMYRTQSPNSNYKTDKETVALISQDSNCITLIQWQKDDK